MGRFTTVFLFCAGFLIAGCGGGGGGGSSGGGTSSGKAGYEVDWTDGANHIWGTICGGQDQPFTLNFTSGEGISGTFACTPLNAQTSSLGSTQGTAIENGNKSGMPAGSSLTYSGDGRYTIGADNKNLFLIFDEQKGTLCTPLGCQTYTLPGISNTLELLPTSKCN